LKSTLKPGENYHPCEIILDEIKARGMTAKDLAKNMRSNEQVVNNLLSGLIDISISIAVRLEFALAIPEAFWTTLQENYNRNLDSDFDKEDKKLFDEAKQRGVKEEDL
jgi:plasmid maintenance system antidote protein VapI